MTVWLKQINQFLWGTYALWGLMGVHLFFTVYTGGIQKKIGKAIALSVQDRDGKGGFGALATTLAATLGTGNIVGVSTAVALGGPEAVFFCWLTGIFGMATTYAECYLAKLYGGPMQYIEKGLKLPFLAACYALLVMASSFGVGGTTQANALAAAFTDLFPVPAVLPGTICALLVYRVICGSSHKLVSLCEGIVPAMGILYLLWCFILLWINRGYLGEALGYILIPHFSSRAAFSGVAGGMLSAGVKRALRYGVTRGLFTNEAGLGSAGIAAGESPVEDAGEQALISMTAAFWDTVVMCGITGLVIVSNLLRFPESAADASIGELVHAAFRQIPVFGVPLLNVSLILFAFATLIGWFYFGKQAFLYLFPERFLPVYQMLYVCVIIFGAVLSLDFVWELTDTINFFMMLPNLLAILYLRRNIKKSG